jgi:tripeptide aminopeptidase
VRICFTRDEEIGRGTDGLDLEKLGAVAGYTLDGSTAGEIQDETFGALEATVTFRGVAAHPGTAKGRLVNALKPAADFVASLPRDRLSPETTEDREGFLHPRRVAGLEEECAVIVILRDFDGEKLRAHEELLRRLAADAAAAHPGSAVEVEVVEQYRNMKEVLDEHPRVVEAAQEATRRAGLEPKLGSARGGTDGSRLSERGLPTPNVFTGGQDYHSRHEWLCVADLGAAVATAVHLVQVWAEDPHER